jgi:hypothetical protein
MIVEYLINKIVVGIWDATKVKDYLLNIQNNFVVVGLIVVNVTIIVQVVISQAIVVNPSSICHVRPMDVAVPLVLVVVQIFLQHVDLNQEHQH